MLDTYTPAKGVCMHPNDKEWMTPYIKTQIRARQKAFTKGDNIGSYLQYRKLCAKVANLITNAKQRYYENKASSIRFSNPRKWFKCIYSLCGAQKQPSYTPTHTTQMELESTANKLLDAFIAPWANRVPNSLAAKVAEVDIIDHEQLLPSIGQVKTILTFLNPKKATSVDGVPAWVLKRFHEELAQSIHIYIYIYIYIHGSMVFPLKNMEIKRKTKVLPYSTKHEGKISQKSEWSSRTEQNL